MSHYTSLSVKSIFEYLLSKVFEYPYSRYLSYYSVKQAQIRREGYIFRNLSPWSLVCYWGLVSRHTRFLCILHDRHLVAIALESLQRKNQFIWPLPHPIPSLACGPAGTIWLHSVTSNYSTCISYNIFIFVRFVWNFHTIFYTHTASS